MLRAKNWVERIQDGRDPNQTKTLKVMVHENLSASQGGSKRESNKGCEGSRLCVDINAHNELIARMEQLEKSVKSTQCTLMSLERNSKCSL